MKVNIDPDTIDSMLFSTARYYIGRHTIHAHSGAIELAEFLRDNPKVMSTGRREFFAKDIRERINDVIHWSSNIHTEGQQEYHKPDALVLLCRAVITHMKDKGLHIVNSYSAKGKPDEFKPSDYNFHINLNTGTVSIKKQEGPRMSSISPVDLDELISDLTVWSKLAGWLDPTVKVSAKYDDTVITDEPGFEFPSMGRYEGEQNMHLHMNTVNCDHYINNPYRETYIAPDCITAVNKISSCCPQCD